MSSADRIFVLAVDIGTSGIRASVYDRDGVELPDLKAKAATPFAESGTVTPDAEELLSSVIDVLDLVASSCRDRGISPKKAAISCFWHSLVGTDISGDPTTPVLTWADTSSAGAAASLGTAADETEVHNRTGCHFHSSYWPAKLLHLRRKAPETFANTAHWLSFSDLVLERLTGDLLTGVSMASATGLFDIRSREWDAELLRLTGVEKGSLPPVMKPAEELSLLPELRERWPALAETAWIAPVGDGAANNLGAGAAARGVASLMIGTSGALRTVYEGPIPEKIPEGIFCYLLDDRRVCLGGAVSDGGSLRRWLTESLGLDVPEETLAERLAESGPGFHRLSFLPFVFGERSTGYHDEASGAVIGLTRGSDAADIVLAALESVGFRLAAILSKVEEVAPVKKIIASGGSLESSPVWQKIVADILGRDLEIFPEGGVSRRGAAVLALSRCVDEMKSEGPVPGEPVRYDPAAHASYSASLERHLSFYRRMFQ